MGQYYMIVNLDKREYMHPHRMGSGLKLLEIAGCNLPRVLPLLLHQSTGRGGGDGDIDNEVIAEYRGRWAGDRIMFLGDYDDKYEQINKEIDNDGGEYDDLWTDISFDARYAYEKWMVWAECHLGKTWGHEDDWREFLESKGETYEKSEKDGSGRITPDLIFRV